MDNEHYEAEKKRFKELFDRAEKTRSFCYTGFHSPVGAAIACGIAVVHKIPAEPAQGCFRVCEGVAAWGGYEDAERLMIRFGDPDATGYDEPFPIVVIKIAPKQQKYADKLSHRDFLGALINLGIERDVLGDIIVHENEGYVFAAENMAEYITLGLTRVKHTPVDCSIIDVLPEDAKPRLKEMDINVSSLRLDGIVAHVFNMSRGEVKSLFSSEKVSVGGFVQKSAAKEPSEDDVISVRGYGKFKYKGISHETKKGHYVVKVLKYV